MSDYTTETANAAAAGAPVPSDLEIAQRATMRPIEEVAAAAGVVPEALEFYGRFKAKIDPARLTRGGQPRRRALDLAIAATPNVHSVPLLTLNAADLQIIDDLVDVRSP